MRQRLRDPAPQRRSAAQWVSHGLAVGAFAVVLSGVPADASAPASAAAGNAGERSLAAIEQLIGQVHCTSSVQCRVAGIGARPCGGPESYRAWSTHVTRAAELELQLRDYAHQRQRWHEKTDLMSTCEIRAAPHARCERPGKQVGRCVLVPATDSVR